MLLGYFIIFTRNTLYCDQSNVYSSRIMFWSIPIAGCLQLLEILEIFWNLIGPPRNFCVRC